MFLSDLSESCRVSAKIEDSFTERAPRGTHASSLNHTLILHGLSRPRIAEPSPPIGAPRCLRKCKLEPERLTLFCDVDHGIYIQSHSDDRRGDVAAHHAYSPANSPLLRRGIWSLMEFCPAKFNRQIFLAAFGITAMWFLLSIITSQLVFFAQPMCSSHILSIPFCSWGAFGGSTTGAGFGQSLDVPLARSDTEGKDRTAVGPGDFADDVKGTSIKDPPDTFNWPDGDVTAICVSIDRLCTEFVVYLLIVLEPGSPASCGINRPRLQVPAGW